MHIDSYESPDSESLLIAGRDRHRERRLARRLLSTEAAGAAVFLAVAIPLAALAPWTRPLSLTALGATAIAYLVATQVTFPVGSAFNRPTQLVFVPMLFLLPTPVVPLIVAAYLVADLWPHVLRGTLSPTRVVARLGDSFYALGPALVLVLAAQESFSWERWPLLLIAFGAQLLFDTGSGLARTWFAERIAPAEQLPMLWLYLTDACLSCIGLMVAASSVRRPGLVLLVLPLVGLLWLFARERRQRIDNELALSTAYRGTALLLGDVVEADDHYTGAHSRDVVDLAVAVAGALRLDAATRRNVEFAALLHDVGKLRVPKAIINKPGPLDADEWTIIRRHTIEGETMLTQVGGVLATVGHYVRSSHERYDGSGYPDGLAGEAIPIESRIVCACDAYSAMTTDRPYRPALAERDAISELRRCAGTHFDPRIVDAIVKQAHRRAPVRPSMRFKRPFSQRPLATRSAPSDRPPAVPV
jgi:HD-GYP domain-containing protein (c-di-GMP phosphodiesterase class II)